MRPIQSRVSSARHRQQTEACFTLFFSLSNNSWREGSLAFKHTVVKWVEFMTKILLHIKRRSLPHPGPEGVRPLWYRLFVKHLLHNATQHDTRSSIYCPTNMDTQNITSVYQKTEQLASVTSHAPRTYQNHLMFKQRLVRQNNTVKMKTETLK